MTAEHTVTVKTVWKAFFTVTVCFLATKQTWCIDAGLFLLYGAHLEQCHITYTVGDMALCHMVGW